MGQTGVREILGETIDQLVNDQQMRATEPLATVLIQAIDHDLWPETATITVDWVDGFAGDQPSERRAARAPELWAERFAPDLRNAADRVRGQEFTRVRIDGAFRLATAIYAGSVFSDVRGFHVAVPGRSGDGTWTGDVSSDGDRRDQALTRADYLLEAGDELAIGINVSGDLTTAVLRHAENAYLPIERLIVLSLPEPGRDALGEPAEVRGCVHAITDRLRTLADDGWPRLHVFYYGPRTAGVLLGHRWNRMPPTQLWDDLGPGGGYTPSFELPST